MDGIPLEALYLLQFARFHSTSNPRLSALAYATCADFRGINPIITARFLFNAARQLHLPSRTSQSQNDSPRALRMLEKALTLTRGDSQGRGLWFKSISLMERIYWTLGELTKVGGVLKLAIEGATGRNSAEWWVYFKGREMEWEVRRGGVGAVNRAVRIATECGVELGKGGDDMAACAFALGRCQYLLGLPIVDFNGVEGGMKAAFRSLKRAGGGSMCDLRFLDLVRCVLRGIERVRKGDFSDEGVVKRMKDAYKEVVEIQEGRGRRGIWKWASPKVIAVLARHVMASFNNGRVGRGRLVCMMDMTVAEAGVLVKKAGAALMVEVGALGEGINRRAAEGLAVTVLEAAARQRLMSLDMVGAAELIGAVVEFVFKEYEERSLIFRAEGGELVDLKVLLTGDRSSSEVRLRSCVLLLCAEYHNLLGKLFHANIAGKFLKAVLSTAQAHGNRLGVPYVSDAWQKAQSLESMLTGEPRPQNIVRTVLEQDGANLDQNRSNGTVTSIGNMHVLSIAWFTIGVYEMRNGDVLESRTAMQTAIDAIGSSAGSSEQVIANVQAVTSGFSLNTDQIPDQAEQSIHSALNCALALSDTVTLSRALRQLKKLTQRQSLTNKSGQAAYIVAMENAEKRCQECFIELKRKQTSARRRLIDEPTL